MALSRRSPRLRTLAELCLTPPFPPIDAADVTQTDRRIIANVDDHFSLASLGPNRVRRNNLTPSRWYLPPEERLRPIDSPAKTARSHNRMCLSMLKVRRVSSSRESPGFPRLVLYQQLLFGSSFSRFPPQLAQRENQRALWRITINSTLPRSAPQPRIPDASSRSASWENMVRRPILGASGPSPQDPHR